MRFGMIYLSGIPNLNEEKLFDSFNLIILSLIENISNMSIVSKNLKIGIATKKVTYGKRSISIMSQ